MKIGIIYQLGPRTWVVPTLIGFLLVFTVPLVLMLSSFPPYHRFGQGREGWKRHFKDRLLPARWRHISAAIHDPQLEIEEEMYSDIFQIYQEISRKPPGPNFLAPWLIHYQIRFPFRTFEGVRFRDPDGLVDLGESAAPAKTLRKMNLSGRYGEMTYCIPLTIRPISFVASWASFAALTIAGSVLLRSAHFGF